MVKACLGLLGHNDDTERVLTVHALLPEGTTVSTQTGLNKKKPVLANKCLLKYKETSNYGNSYPIVFTQAIPGESSHEWLFCLEDARDAVKAVSVARFCLLALRQREPQHWVE